MAARKKARAKQPRPKYVRLAVYMREQQAQQLSEFATQLGLSRSAVITLAIGQLIKSLTVADPG